MLLFRDYLALNRRAEETTVFRECFRYLNRLRLLRSTLRPPPSNSCNLACVILRDCRGFIDCKIVWAFGQIRLDCLKAVKCCEVDLYLSLLDPRLAHPQNILELMKDEILKIESHSI